MFYPAVQFVWHLPVKICISATGDFKQDFFIKIFIYIYIDIYIYMYVYINILFVWAEKA